jgi:hypothetical protein
MSFASRRLILALLLGPWITGCTNTSDTSPSAGGGQGGGYAAHVMRGKENILNQNTLKQIGYYYQIYITNSGGQPPPSLDVFLDQIKDSRNEYQILKDGVVILQLTRPNSSTILAYEKDADLNGNRWVLMGDCNSVKLMPEQEFRAALGPG